MFTPRKQFKPRKFLKLASQLIADRKYEEPCRIRTAVGRAYYAAHLYLKEKLKRLGYRAIVLPEDHRIHQAIIDLLMDRGDTTVGTKLDKLYDKRRIADYDMGTPLSRNQGIYCLRLSENIIYHADLLRRKR